MASVYRSVGDQEEVVHVRWTSSCESAGTPWQQRAQPRTAIKNERTKRWVEELAERVKSPAFAESTAHSPLSSFDDSEDDCDRRRPPQPIAVALVHTSTLALLEFQPARPHDPGHAARSTYQETDIQTDHVAQDAIQTKDRAEQTEAIELRIASTQVDAPQLASYLERRLPAIDLSAFERIMRHLSQQQHIKQLQAWLQPETARTHVRLLLSPFSPYASKIILAAYDSNQESCIFVAEADGRFVVEIWSLRNLLSPIKAQKLLIEDEPHSLKIFNENIAIAARHVIVLTTNRITDDFTEIQSVKHTIVALEFMQGKLHCLTEERLFLLVSKTPPHFFLRLRTSPLFHTTKALALAHEREKVAEVLSDRTIVCFSNGDSQNYEAIRIHSDNPFNEATGISIAFDESCAKLLFLNRTEQIVSVWHLDEPRRPRATLHFPSDELTVDAVWSGHNLFTLTHDGILSKWELFANGRKLRSQLWSTGLKHCIRICLLDVAMRSQRFSVHTATSVVFLIFPE